MCVCVGLCEALHHFVQCPQGPEGHRAPWKRVQLQAVVSHNIGAGNRTSASTGSGMNALSF